MIKGGTSYSYHRDASGSITTLTDSSNNVAASYRYDAFGNQLQSADAVGNPDRWDALEWDTTTGLIHDGARFYDPVTGRHLTPDSTMGDPYGFTNVNDAEAFTQTLAPAPSSPRPASTPTVGSSSSCTPQQLLGGYCQSEAGGGGQSSGRGSGICASRWFDLDVAVVVGIASIILSWAAMTVAQATIPSLLVQSEFGVSGQIADLVYAFIAGDTGGFVSHLLTILGIIFYAALAVAGFWTALGILSETATIWSVVLEVAVSLAFIGWDIYQFAGGNCISL